MGGGSFYPKELKVLGEGEGDTRVGGTGQTPQPKHIVLGSKSQGSEHTSESPANVGRRTKGNSVSTHTQKGQKFLQFRVTENSVVHRPDSPLGVMDCGRTKIGCTTTRKVKWKREKWVGQFFGGARTTPHTCACEETVDTTPTSTRNPTRWV